MSIAITSDFGQKKGDLLETSQGREFVIVHGKEIFVDDQGRLILARLGISDPAEIECLESISSLSFINLDDNALEHLPDLSRFKDLEGIVACNNHLIDLSGLEELSSLKGCLFSNNDLISTRGLEKNKDLENLSMNFNKIERLEGFEDFTELKELEASYNQIASLAGLENCFKLEKLELRNNKIAKIAYIEHLQFLHHIDISENELETLDGIPWQTVENLNISANKITRLELQRGIHNLNASSNSIKSIIVNPNATEDDMIFNYLDLDNNQISDLDWINKILVLDDPVGLTGNPLKNVEGLRNASPSLLVYVSTELMHPDAVDRLNEIDEIRLARN